MVEAATAKKLLSFFGSVERVFTATEKELMKVDGIGPKKAKRIRDLLTEPYGVTSSSDVVSQSDQGERRGS